MSFQCQDCKKYTLDMDEPPCGEACQKFVPRQVLTIHHAKMEEGQLKLTCTGEPSLYRAKITSSPFASTCPLCLEKLRTPSSENKQSEKPVVQTDSVTTSTEEPKPVEQQATLKSLGFEDDEIGYIQAHADKNNLPELTTPTGLRAWVDAGNDLTVIKHIGEVTKNKLLPLLMEN